MKLIENTTFGFECKSKEKNFKTRLEYLDWYEKSRNNYDLFLEQPLKLEMFVPCDEDGNILEEPLAYNFKSVQLFTNYNIKYQKAKEKVLFEGFELKEELEFVYKFKYKGKEEFNVLKHDLPIEWLVGDEIELTPNAIKQLGL